ncbi:hypothetical protein [Arthrobacter sp. Soil736]|uniref:hypothetical protein n=1 Tax=Arthrobacter sp. Soil736 TaxID=1736395 RepID=UPI000B1EB43F|nr:hypothetical protein [Arthrobacter sp. Soil736]
MNQGMPAVARWREREAEVLASGPQLDYISPLLVVASRVRSAVHSFPSASAVSFGNPGVAKPPNFQEILTVWRLISGNQRELARGVGIFTDYARAAAHAGSIRDAAPRLSITLVKHPGTRSLGWYASIGSRPVMMTPAWHRTARDRDRSVATALQALGGAKILAAAAQHGHRHLSESVPTDVLTGQLL